MPPGNHKTKNSHVEMCKKKMSLDPTQSLYQDRIDQHQEITLIWNFSLSEVKKRMKYASKVLAFQKECVKEPFLSHSTLNRGGKRLVY